MAFRRVVVGVDFSERSFAAARWVAESLAPGAEIVLVHALRQPEAPPFIRPLLDPMLEVLGEVVPALYGALRDLADVLGTDRVAIDMREGAPAEELAEAAVESDADLICIGRKKRTAGSARFGANTAERLLARTRLPVLVVPAARSSAPVRLLAAVDGGSDTPTALTAAWRIASARDARLQLLHVLGSDLRAFVRACRSEEHASGIVALLTRSRRFRVRDEMHLLGLTHDWMESQLAAIGTPSNRARLQVRVGEPGHEIVAQARASDVDLVILGRGGPPIDAASSMQRLPIGSTARLVTWAAPCPVLVMPPTIAAMPPAPPSWRARRSPPPASNGEVPMASAESDGLPPAAAHTRRAPSAATVA